MTARGPRACSTRCLTAMPVAPLLIREDFMPWTHSMALRLGKKLTDVRKSGKLWWLRPDGKTQVTIQYLQKSDGSVEPQKIHTVVISTQHAEPSKAVRSKECAGYTGPEMTAPSMEEMNKLIVEEVVKKTLDEIKLKNGKSALTLFDDSTHLHINPTGKFIIGGPQGDAGLTGRKIIIDTYGGWGALGGVHLPSDGKVCREERPLQARTRAALVCHRRGQASVPLRRDLWHRAGGAHCGRHYERHQDRLRLPPRRHRSDLGPARAQVPGDGALLPLRPGALHREWCQVLRVGERQGPVAVQGHDVSAGRCCSEGQQLLDQVGGLSLERGSRCKFHLFSEADAASRVLFCLESDLDPSAELARRG